MWYLYIAAAFGIIFELMRPKKYDNIGLWPKIYVPLIAGLIWPVMLGWFIVITIKEWVT